MLDIAKIQPAFPLNGEITTMTHLRGTVKKPVISNNLKAENININGFNIENATGEFYLTPEKFHIGTLSINSGDMSVEGKGYLEKDKDTDLSLEGNNISIDLIGKNIYPRCFLRPGRRSGFQPGSQRADKRTGPYWLFSNKRCSYK